MRPMHYNNGPALVAKHGELHIPSGFQPLRTADGNEYLIPGDRMLREARARHANRRRTGDMLTFDTAGVLHDRCQGQRDRASVRCSLQHA